MRCADDGTLWAYAQGDLGVDERAQLDVHLASCAHCRDAVSRIDTSRAFLRAAARDHPKVNWDAVEHAIAAAAASQVAARPRWRMRGAFAVLGAVSALGLVCLWARVSHRAEITVEAASGAGVIGSLAPDAPAKAVLQAGATLGSGASLVTAEGGSALLQLPDSSRARLGPLTRARFAQVDRAEIEIHLGVGRLAVEAAHAGRRRFLVDAGSVRVTVVGTVFRVERDGDRVIVAVARGQVRVDADALPPRFLDAGRRLVTGAGGAALAEGALTAEDGEAFGHLGVIPIALDASRATTDPPAPPIPPPRRDAVVSGERNVSSTRASTPRSRSRPERKRVPAQNRDTPQPAPNSTTPAAPGPEEPSSGGPPSFSLAPSNDAPSAFDADWRVSSSLAERARSSGLPITGEGLFLQRAKESIEAGTCQHHLPDLAEVGESSRDMKARETARILRARCYDEQHRPVQARREYQRYLEEFPMGRFVGEARGALQR